MEHIKSLLKNNINIDIESAFSLFLDSETNGNKFKKILVNKNINPLLILQKCYTDDKLIKNLCYKYKILYTDIENFMNKPSNMELNKLAYKYNIQISDLFDMVDLYYNDSVITEIFQKNIIEKYNIGIEDIIDLICVDSMCIDLDKIKKFDIIKMLTMKDFLEIYENTDLNYNFYLVKYNFYPDFIITINDIDYNLHKNYIIKKSGYFKLLLENNFMKEVKFTLDIHNFVKPIDKKYIWYMIQYLYDQKFSELNYMYTYLRRDFYRENSYLNMSILDYYHISKILLIDDVIDKFYYMIYLSYIMVQLIKNIDDRFYCRYSKYKECCYEQAYSIRKGKEINYFKYTDTNSNKYIGFSEENGNCYINCIREATFDDPFSKHVKPFSRDSQAIDLIINSHKLFFQIMFKYAYFFWIR